jgi:hypothetical protein
MQETNNIKTPAQELLDLLLTTQKLEQHYICQIEFETGYTILNLYNKEHRLLPNHLVERTVA